MKRACFEVSSTVLGVRLCLIIDYWRGQIRGVFRHCVCRILCRRNLFDSLDSVFGLQFTRFDSFFRSLSTSALKHVSRQTQARHGASPRSRDESTKYDSAH
jgi:hypothetical protein